MQTFAVIAFLAASFGGAILALRAYKALALALADIWCDYWTWRARNARRRAARLAPISRDDHRRRAAARAR